MFLHFTIHGEIKHTTVLPERPSAVIGNICRGAVNSYVIQECKDAALLMGLVGACIHIVSTNPLIRLFYRTDCVQRSNFILNFMVEIYLLFFRGGGYTLSMVRLIVSLTGRKGRER